MSISRKHEPGMLRTDLRGFGGGHSWRAPQTGYYGISTPNFRSIIDYPNSGTNRRACIATTCIAFSQMSLKENSIILKMPVIPNSLNESKSKKKCHRNCILIQEKCIIMEQGIGLRRQYIENNVLDIQRQLCTQASCQHKAQKEHLYLIKCRLLHKTC